jgi:hypothetical protein
MTLKQLEYLRIHFFSIKITNLNHFEIPLHEIVRNLFSPSLAARDETSRRAQVESLG